MSIPDLFQGWSLHTQNFVYCTFLSGTLAMYARWIISIEIEHNCVTLISVNQQITKEIM